MLQLALRTGLKQIKKKWNILAKKIKKLSGQITNRMKTTVEILVQLKMKTEIIQSEQERKQTPRQNVPGPQGYNKRSNGYVIRVLEEEEKGETKKYQNNA